MKLKNANQNSTFLSLLFRRLLSLVVVFSQFFVLDFSYAGNSGAKNARFNQVPKNKRKVVSSASPWARIIGTAMLSLSAYFVYREGQATEEGDGSSVGMRALGSGARSADTEARRQALNSDIVVPPQSIQELQESYTLAKSAAQFDQDTRLNLASKSLEIALGIMNEGGQGYTDVTSDDVDEIQFIFLRAKHYQFLSTIAFDAGYASYLVEQKGIKLDVKSQSFDYEYCQQLEGIYGFFVEDDSKAGKKIVLCHKFFELALTQPTPDLQMDFAVKMYLSLILQEGRMSPERIQELLFSGH